MRVYRSDEDEGLIWVAATVEGSWLIRVEPKYTDTFLRPKDKGLMPRARHYGPTHQADAVFDIKGKQLREWEAL